MSPPRVRFPPSTQWKKSSLPPSLSITSPCVISSVALCPYQIYFSFSVKAKTVSISPPLHSQHLHDFSRWPWEPAVQPTTVALLPRHGPRGVTGMMSVTCPIQPPETGRRGGRRSWVPRLQFSLLKAMSQINRRRFLFQDLDELNLVASLGVAWENWNRL